MKYGKVTYRKAMKSGKYDVCVGGKTKYGGVGLVEARMKANKLRKLQGKKEVLKAVRKLARK